MGAAIVLTIDMVTSIDTFQSSTVLAQKRLEISHALDIFKSYSHNDVRIDDIIKCSRTIEALLAAIDQRQRLTLRMGRRVDGDLQGFFHRVASVLAGTAGKFGFIRGLTNRSEPYVRILGRYEVSCDDDTHTAISTRH